MYQGGYGGGFVPGAGYHPGDGGYDPSYGGGIDAGAGEWTKAGRKGAPGGV